MVPLIKNLLDSVASKTVLVLDGAMATALYDRGFYINRSFEELSLTEPSAVKEVTRSFKKAGAQIIHTNTFNASIPKLTTYGLQSQLDDIIINSAKLAREVIQDDGFVLGLVGPLGVLVEPLGPTSVIEAEDMFSQNIKAFEKTDVDGIALNGFHDLNELSAAIRSVKSHSKKPLFVSIGVQENTKTSQGHKIDEFVVLAEKMEVDALGICGEVGPSGMLTALEQLRPLTKKPIYLLPNAGLPSFVNDQYIYLCNPDYIGKYAKRFVQAGVNMIGGHCGVGDSHIKAISNSIKMSMAFEADTFAKKVKVTEATVKPLEPIPLEIRSNLGRALKEKSKPVTVEIVPPFVADFPKFVEHCQKLQAGGVKYVNIPDGARAIARISSLQLASFVKNNFEIEPIPHFTCRDRNLIGLQSDILGAYVNGVRNVLLITGDPPKLGNTPGATAVYDVDAIGLTHIVSRMNHGLDMGGSRVGQQTEFLIGVALNPTAKNQELEIQRFKYKIEAGADYAITQPIYNLETYKNFFDKMGHVDIPILMGIWPLVSVRNAEFLKYEVPGVDVPDWVVDELKKAGDHKEEVLKRGAEIAIKTMIEAKKLVAGFQVSAPFNRVDVALRVIKESGVSDVING